MMPYSISPPALHAASLCIGIILKHTRGEVGSMRPGHSRLIGIRRRTCLFAQAPANVPRMACWPHPRTHASSQEELVLGLARPGTVRVVCSTSP